MLARLHKFLQHVVKVEIAQGAVQVIRATHRTSWFHASETLHRLLGQCSHETLIAIHQGFHQHLRDFFRGQAVHSPGRTLTFALLLLHLLLHLAPHLLKFIFGAFTDFVLGPAHREIHLENSLKRTPVGAVLHHRCSERILERVSIFERNMSNCLHSVKVLRQRNRQTGVAEFLNEARKKIKHERQTTVLVRSSRQKVLWQLWRYQTDTSAKHAKFLWPFVHQLNQC